MEILKKIAKALETGDDRKVGEQVREALEEGLTASEILDRGLVPGMNVVGERFRRREIFLPEVLLAARAMKAGVGVLEPHLAGGEVPSRGTVVLGTIQGDLHDIGKNLVGIMLEGSGYRIVDLGTDVAPKAFVDAAEAEGASIIGVSALLTTTMSRMGEVVEMRDDRGLAGRVHVVVGGAPLSREFADSIGAAAYGYDAADAVERIAALTGGE
jgi:5-methyltetrahydrofolate--homocysteine methyltransferase